MTIYKNGLMVWQLKKYFSSHYSDIFDLIDIHSIIDSSLTYRENFNILKNEFDLISEQEFNLKFSEIITNIEILFNSKSTELFNILQDIKENSIKLYNRILNQLEIKDEDIKYLMLDFNPIKPNDFRENIYIELKNILKSLHRKHKQKIQNAHRIFKDNYTQINNFIDISYNAIINDINKVVNILKSNKDLKFYKVFKNEYKFFFQNGFIGITKNQLSNEWYISHNNTTYKEFNYFVLHKSFKYLEGVKRKAWVENNKGNIEYYYKDYKVFNATNGNLKNEFNNTIKGIKV